jgi:hypothetical protein
MDMITSLIQKNDMIMMNCCAPPEARLYTVNICVLLLCKLFDSAWADKNTNCNAISEKC